MKNLTFNTKVTDRSVLTLYKLKSKYVKSIHFSLSQAFSEEILVLHSYLTILNAFTRKLLPKVCRKRPRTLSTTAANNRPASRHTTISCAIRRT